MKVKIESVKKKSIYIRIKRNWNEQYSRKKNMKIDYCEERRRYITSYVVQIDDGPFNIYHIDGSVHVFTFFKIYICPKIAFIE